MGLRTGAQYLASLRDGRKVMYDGKLVEDVTAFRGMRRGAHVVAQFYDFQNLPGIREHMTYTTPDGEVAGIAFMQPRSRDDLRRRAASFALWADVSCGFVGRSPDYMNVCLATAYTVSQRFTALSPATPKHLAKWYDEVRRNNLCLTHSFIPPFANRRSDASGNLSVTPMADGLRLKGIRGVATIAPFANYNFVMEQTPLRCEDGSLRYCWFLLPVASPRCTWISRDSFNDEGAHEFTPLASRGDELDGMVIIDDLLVPWDQVIINETDLVAASKHISDLADVYGVMKHHNTVRGLSKLRFLFGLAHLVAESSGVNQFANVKERLGEITHMLMSMKAFVDAQIEGAYEDPVTKVWHVGSDAARTAALWCGQFCARAVDIIMELAAGRLMSCPQKRTMDVLGPAIEKYFSSQFGDDEKTLGLFRLAWDISGTPWGVRQTLYEQFSVGGQALNRMIEYERYDKKAAIAMVERILAHPYSDEHPYPYVPAADGRHGDAGRSRS